MENVTHGFCSREEWTQWFADYNLIVSEINDTSYELIVSDLPANEWIAGYRHNSRQIREAYVRNEQMLDRHVRWFTRTPGRWTREVADPLTNSLFRYITRVQDLGCAYEIADSLVDFYSPLGDETALMKCYTVRAFSYGFLEPIHLGSRAYEDCVRAAVFYERHFMELTPEEQSMGLSIYDLEFDRFINCLKLGSITPGLLDDMLACYEAANRAAVYVIRTDQGYEFNRIIPDFAYYMGFGALCLMPGMCTAAQAEVIYQAAEHRQHVLDRSGKTPSLNYRVRTGLVYRMAQRLLGLCTDETILAELTQLTQEYFPTLFTGATYSQGAVEAVSAIQLATENLTRHGEKKPALYQTVQEFFARYFTTRPYTTFVDYVCGSYNYCYVLSALPHICDEEILLQTLLKLTMFRQVQTAMHSIMVGRLALELLDRLIDRHPELLSGQLGTTSPEEVVRHRKEFRRYLYSGALLHDIGKVLCSSVINAQSHRLGELEFQVLTFHPVTGGEMLENLPCLSVFRDIALGHHKSYDGTRGYPQEFDNTASPQKIFIDIITICDSLDAATDHLGRNYATAKTFDTVLEELKAGRQTRYSGDLVDLLDGDKDLCAQVRSILEEGRRDVYYDVHKMILSELSVPLKPKKDHDWLFDLGLPYGID